MELQTKITTGYHFGNLTVQEDSGKRKNGYIIWKCICSCGNAVELDTRCIQRNHVTDCGCITKSRYTQLDLTGKRYGKLVCVHPTEQRDKDRSVIWECLCDCGNTCRVSAANLRAGDTKSCGCLKTPVMKDLTGEKYGALTVVEYAGRTDGVHRWKCVCDCGNETVTTQTLLQNGKTRSCGCLRTVMMQKNLKLCEGTSVTLLKKKKMRNNTSGYTGVSYNKKTGKWIAKITFKGKTYYLGSYTDIEEACRIRQRGEEMHDTFLEWYHHAYETTGSGGMDDKQMEEKGMQISQDVIHREIAGEHILIPTGELALQRSGVFVITEIGAEIWEMLRKGKDYDTIITELLGAYTVTEEVLTNDVEEFLQMLQKNELIRI